MHLGKVTMRCVVNREGRKGEGSRNWKDVLIVHYTSTKPRKWMGKRNGMGVGMERMPRRVTDHKNQTLGQERWRDTNLLNSK